ncbi:MAG: FecR family protein, partial [Gammaproteobacteria bacterium]
MHQNTPGDIEDEALTWLTRVNSGDFTAQQAQLLEQWLARDEAHRRAFDEAKRLWQGLEALRDSPVVIEQSTTPKNRSRRDIADIGKRRPSKTFARRLSYASAACVALIALLSGPDPENLRFWFADYHAGVGEQRTVQLADGSIVYLNSSGAFNETFGAPERIIELIEGEAEFVVAKDVQRPFTVLANGYDVTALGTDFIVKKHR